MSIAIPSFNALYHFKIFATTFMYIVALKNTNLSREKLSPYQEQKLNPLSQYNFLAFIEISGLLCMIFMAFYLHLIFDVIMSIKLMESMECMYENVSRYLTVFPITICHVLWYPQKHNVVDHGKIFRYRIKQHMHGQEKY